LSELRQISTNIDNVWHKGGKKNETVLGAFVNFFGDKTYKPLIVPVTFVG